jgi:hypothetical protein
MMLGRGIFWIICSELAALELFSYPHRFIIKKCSEYPPRMKALLAWDRSAGLVEA